MFRAFFHIKQSKCLAKVLWLHNLVKQANIALYYVFGGLFMKIAVTYDNGEVFQHFGHSAQFKIYEVENNKVVKSEVVSTNGSGHGALSAFLGNMGVNKLICGGIGTGAKTALAEKNIEIFGGVSGNADQKVNDLLNDKLVWDPNKVCSHHHEEDGHDCGEDHHGCSGNCGSYDSKPSISLAKPGSLLSRKK